MTAAWLLTGSSGFIGQALLGALNTSLEQPDLVLAGRQAPAVLPPRASHWPLDLSAASITLPPGVHTVVHLAGEKRDASRMQTVNHAGALRLVEAAAQAGARVFVHLSSVGVYGAGHRAGVVNEQHPHTPSGPYETSKDSGERAMLERCAALGLRCTVLQPSNVLGRGKAGSQPLLGLVRIVARGWFRYIGRGEAWVNYVAVEDVAAALLAAAQDGATGGVYIVNTTAPLREFVGWVADELGLPAPTARLPAWLGAVAGALGAESRVRELTGSTRFDGTALCKWMPTPYPLGIEAALRALVRQYRAEGLV
jgi:nucleoside-diphosphate-sugar epimerase